MKNRRRVWMYALLALFLIGAWGSRNDPKTPAPHPAATISPASKPPHNRPAKTRQAKKTPALSGVRSKKAAAAPHTSASPSQSSSDPKESTPYMMASLQKGYDVSQDDPLIGDLRAEMARARSIFEDHPSEQRCGDVILTAQQIMDKRGVHEDLLTLMRNVDHCVPGNMHGILKFSDTAALYVTLRTHPMKSLKEVAAAEKGQ